MSLVKIVLLACVVVVTAKPQTEEQKQALYKELIDACKGQEGASDADVQELVSHQPLSTQTGQCLNACVMESIGYIKDGKLSVEGSIKIAGMGGDPTKVKNSEMISKECESTTGADRCDLATQIMICVGKASAAHGLDPLKDLM